MVFAAEDPSIPAYASPVPGSVSETRVQRPGSQCCSRGLCRRGLCRRGLWVTPNPPPGSSGGGGRADLQVPAVQKWR